MDALVYTLETISPLLVARPGGDLNTIRSYPFIPGSAARGALIQQLERGVLPDDHDLLSGSVRFLDALPARRYAAQDGGYRFERALPPSLMWRRPKHEPFGRIVLERPGSPKEEPSKALGELFVAGEYLVRPEMTVEVGTRRNRRFGRAIAPRAGMDDDPGAVYRMVCVRQGQWFTGAFVGDSKALDRLAVQVQVGTTLRVGRARRTQGDVRVIHLTRVKEWKEAPGPTEVSGRFRLTLLSHGAFRDAWGNDAVAPDAQELAERLGLEAENLHLVGSYVRAQGTGGFNRVANLALPEHIAVAPGSVYEFEITDARSGRTERLLDLGLGERTIDGFGRVAVNLEPPKTLKLWSRAEEPPPRDPLPDFVRPLADLMARRLFERAADEYVADHAGTFRWSRGRPSRSLLARVTEAVAAARRSGGTEGLRQWRADLAQGAASGLRDGVVQGRDFHGSLWSLLDASELFDAKAWSDLRARTAIGGSSAPREDDALRLKVLARVIDHLDLQLRRPSLAPAQVGRATNAR